jgi:hypothetical protein
MIAGAVRYEALKREPIGSLSSRRPTRAGARSKHWLRWGRSPPRCRPTHATFEDYCREKWGMSEGYATRMIVGAQRYDALETLPIGKVFPERESHVRELCRLESDAEAGENWTCKVSTRPPRCVPGASCGCHFDQT